MFNIYRLQDIHIADVPLREQYYNLLLSGQMTQAGDLCTANPQLQGKVINADMLNQLVDAVAELQQKWFRDVPQKLSNLTDEFQLSIDELIYMAEFNLAFQYEINNFVVYQDAIYYCFAFPPVGTLPSDQNYWLRLEIKGETGDDTLGVQYRGAWNTLPVYNRFDMVVFQNTLYVSKTTNNNKQPDQNSGDWLKAVEVIPKTITISRLIPPNLVEGEVWIRLLEGAYTWEEVDNLNYTFQSIGNLQITWGFVDGGGW